MRTKFHYKYQPESKSCIAQSTLGKAKSQKLWMERHDLDTTTRTTSTFDKTTPLLQVTTKARTGALLQCQHGE